MFTDMRLTDVNFPVIIIAGPRKILPWVCGEKP